MRCSVFASPRSRRTGGFSADSSVSSDGLFDRISPRWEKTLLGRRGNTLKLRLFPLVQPDMSARKNPDRSSLGRLLVATASE